MRLVMIDGEVYARLSFLDEVRLHRDVAIGIVEAFYVLAGTSVDDWFRKNGLL